MRVFVVRTDADARTLATTLLQAGATPAIEKTALEQLRSANPRLDFASIKRGTVLLVPDVAGINIGATKAFGEDVLVALEGSLTQAVKSTVERIEASVKADEEEAKSVSNFFGARAMIDLVANDDALRKSLAAVKDEEKLRKASVLAFKKFVESVQGELVNELKALTGLLR